MILKAGKNKKYGIPYMGSKSKIIPQIARFLPDAENFYDLFGGGFSVSHYMIENRFNSYKHFFYNELRDGLPELIQDAINGKFNYDVFKPEWITRERFHLEKDTNMYIKIIWSFGNNGKDYIFGKGIENEKRSMHMACVFDQFDDFMKNTFKIDKWTNKLSITGKRLYLKRLINNRVELQLLQRLEQLERLQQLEQLERLQQLEQLEQKITFSNLDYRNVSIKPNSVIYCDIPYKGTEEYDGGFCHNSYFNWADEQQNPVFISEYFVDDKRFKLIKEFKHRSILSASANNEVTERLYGNKAACDILSKYINFS